VPAPPRRPSEADIAWSINHFRRGGTQLGCLAVVTVVVPAAFAVHSFYAGETVYACLFGFAVLMQVIVLALFSRRRYLLGPGGVTCFELEGTRSHRWSEFSGYRRRGTDLLLILTAEHQRRWVRLPDPPAPDEVLTYVRAYLRELRPTSEGVWR